MATFEYRVERYTVNEARQDIDASDRAFERRFNLLGAEGWQLISVQSPRDGKYELVNCVAIMMREVTDEMKRVRRQFERPLPPINAKPGDPVYDPF